MYNGYSNDEVGIDPTTVKGIESLDDPVPEKNKKIKKIVAPKTKNPDKKPNDNLKKIIFTVIVILLMALVSFGVYYYLNLGTKHAASTSNIEVKLNDLTVVKDSSLPTSLLEYGTFTNVNVVDCSLNTNDVNINEVGTYTYQVVCGKNVYSAKIIVEIPNGVVGNVLYKTLGSSYSVNDFVTLNGDYQLSFANEEELKNDLNSAGSTYIVKINAMDSKGVINTINSVLYVTDKQVTSTLSCKKDTVTYLFAFSNNEAIDIRYEINEFSYDDSEYQSLKNSITTDLYTISGIRGYVIFNDSENKILLVNFGINIDTSYDSIYNTYLNDGYVCN